MNLALSLSPSAAGGAGGAVDPEFKADVNRKFEEYGDGMEEIKELCDELKKEIGHVRNDVAAKFANEQISVNANAAKKQSTDGGVKAGGGTGVSIEKIKAIEEEIKQIKTKF